MGKRRHVEKLPWYRTKGYRGNLSEKQKRILDSYRTIKEHPAATYASLPTEVQNYINRLELEIYDKRQQSLVAGCAFISLMGAFGLYREFWISSEPGLLTAIVGVLLLVGPWIYYPVRWRKNANEFMPDDDPTYPTDEAIKMEWEIEHLSRVREAESERDID